MLSVPHKINPKPLCIAMLSIHSSPVGELGTKNTGGMSVYIKSLAQHLGADGHRVDIFTCAPGKDAVRLLGPNVRLIHLFQSAKAKRMTKEQLPDQVSEIFQLMEDYRRTQHLEYDLIHSHYWISGLVGDLARVHWNCPHAVTFHTLGLLKNTFASGENETQKRQTQERRLTKAAHRVIVPTEDERDFLMRSYQADPQKISVIPCGVDLNRFRILNRPPARRRLGVSEARKVLLYVGRFAPLKGLDRLIEALAALKPHHPEIELMIVGGDGPDADSFQALHRMVTRRRLEKNVRLVGRIGHRELSRYYAAADILVLPSQYESFGLVVLEALACGIPVAASPVGIARTLIREGVNGILFDSPAAEDISAGLGRLISLPITGRPSRRQIRSSVLELGWDRVGVQMAGVYDLLVREGNNNNNLDPSSTSTMANA